MSLMPTPLPTRPSPPSGRMIAVDGTELPLVGTQIEATAGGGQARVTLRQRFVNAGTTPLDVTYTVPLPADGAVSGYRFELGDTVVEGEVHKKAEAREQYEAALIEGKTAALLEEESTSLFTQSLGNIPPGTNIDITITVDHPLLWNDAGGWEWRFPTVVAPQYLGGVSEERAEKLQVVVADGDIGARFGCTLAVSDSTMRAPESPSHTVLVEDGTFSVAGSELNRDVVLRWGVATAHPGATVDLSRPAPKPGDAGDPSAAAYGRFTLIPPKLRPDTHIARDLVVLVDVSGSMGGEPLAQARKLLARLIRGLGPSDHLEMLKFSHSVERWKPHAISMDGNARVAALRWVDGLVAGGATMMLGGILEALKATPKPHSQRQLLLVTDGFIGHEEQIVEQVLLERPEATRVHTLGVGSSVNRTLTESVARAGGGLELIVAPGEPVEEAVSTLLHRTEAPLVVDVSVSGDALCDGLPFRMPDLFAGAPGRFYARMNPEGGTLHIEGRSASGPWSHVVEVAPIETASGDASIATGWARQRVADLEFGRLGGQPPGPVDTAITRLGLSFAIATRLTSWLAVTKTKTVDGLGPKRRVVQPHSVPKDVSIENFGLRERSPTMASLGGSTDSMFAYGTRSAAPQNARKARRRQAPGSATQPLSLGEAPSFDEESDTNKLVAYELSADDTKTERSVNRPVPIEAGPTRLDEGAKAPKSLDTIPVGSNQLVLIFLLLTSPLWAPFYLVYWLFNRWFSTRD